MSREELVIYRFTCDDCGEVEDSETDESPVGWAEDGGEDVCDQCGGRPTASRRQLSVGSTLAPLAPVEPRFRLRNR